MESDTIVRQAPGGFVRPASPPGPVGRSPYWKHAPWVTIAMLSVIAVRIHELYPGLAPLRPVLLIGFGGMALLASRTRPAAFRSIWKYAPTRIVILYFLWVGFTAPFGLWPTQSLEVLRSLTSPVLLFLAVILNAPTRSNLEKILWGAVGATSLYLVLAPAANAVFGGGWRLGSAGAYDPNDLAALAASVFPLSVGLFIRSRGVPRVLAAVAGGVLVLGVIQTGSRGGILALLAGALVVTLGLRGARLFLILFALTVGGLVAWNQASVEFRDRMATFTDLSEDYNVQDEGGRIETWRRARGYVKANPLLGVGAGNFGVAEGEWLARQGRTGKWSTAHNAYYQAAAELGLMGAGLLIGLLLLLGSRALRVWREGTKRKGRSSLVRPEILASLVACATGAIFLSMAYSWILFAVASWVALTDRVARAEVAATQQRNGSMGSNPRGLRQARYP